MRRHRYRPRSPATRHIEDAPVRLAAIRLLRLSTDPAAQTPVAQLLADADPTVRFAAVEWVAEARLSGFRDQLSAGLATGATNRALFEAYLAALERLDGVRRAVKDEWSGEQYALSLVENSDTAPAVRARALRVLRSDHPGLTIALLSQLADAADLPTRLEAVRSLRERAEPEARGAIDQLAMNANVPVDLRAEAIVGIAADTPERKNMLVELATGDQPALRREALRSLRGADLDAQERARLAESSPKDPDRELTLRLLGADNTAAPRPHRYGRLVSAIASGRECRSRRADFLSSAGRLASAAIRSTGEEGRLGPSCP